jgi:CSLREA domain-containing protein
MLRAGAARAGPRTRAPIPRSPALNLVVELPQVRRSSVLAGLLAALSIVALAVPVSAAPPVEPAVTTTGVTPAGTRLAGSVKVTIPRTARKDRLTSVRLTLPTSVGAIDGRLLIARRAATLMGVAIHGSGTAMRPVAIKGGYAFGAYGLAPRKGFLIIDLVVLPQRSGALDLQVIVDSAAARAGTRVRVSGARTVGRVAVGRADRRFAAPAAGTSPVPLAAAGAMTEALPNGKFDRRDLDVARADWEAARLSGRVCGARTPGDLDGDGCTDAVDLQKTVANLGVRTRWTKTTRPAADDETTRRQVVTSTADTPDAAPGNGVCADSQGRCTFRAALMEAEYLVGDDRITFDLPGTAPVVIQIGSRLPLVTSRVGTLAINGFTQNGARANDAQHTSNQVPGVVIRGNGSGAREYGLYITSPDNIVRGMAFTNLYRGIMLDGPNAANNRIAGNWFGFDGAGNSQSQGNYGILLNNGAHDNLIGGTSLADRNVMGAWRTPIDLYGPGTDRNVIVGNLLCIKPNGTTAFCYSGVDHNFGPKENQIGGDGDGERNVIGPTTLQGIELSHGWDPKLPYGTDTATTWQVNSNRVIGNWVGFKADGSYAANYRSGYQVSNADNGNAINVYDGTNDNIVARNFVAAAFDGIQVMSSNSERNVVRGNTIGESPKGEAAPMSGWGVVVRWGTRHDIIRDNTIRNAEKGGIGLLNVTNYGTAVAVAYNIRISHNIVTNTSGPAIHLATVQDNPGQTANDSVQPPVIEVATTALVRGTAHPGATVEVYRASRGEGARGLPVEHLGDAAVGDDGTWRLDVTGLSDGDRVTALQIRADDNTSELAVNAFVGEAPPPPPPPQPGDLLAADTFSRTEDSGWGTADTGGTWSVGTTGTYLVDNGAGRIVIGAGQTREARLEVDAADVVVTGTVRYDKLPVGGNTFAYVLARATPTTAYRGAIRIASDGRVFVQLKRVVDRAESNIGSEVNTGLTTNGGGALNVRFRVVGDQLKLRVWQGATEPDAWSATATDATVTAAAGAGFMGYLGKAVSNGAATLSVDDVEIRRG